MHGLVRELFGLIGLIGGFMVASHSATPTSEIIQHFIDIDNDYLSLLLGFILSFVCFVFVIYLAGLLIQKLFAMGGLGVVDSVGGFLFGFLKAFFIFSIIVYFITKIEFLDARINKAMHNSFMYPLLKDTGYFIMTSEDMQLQNKLNNAVSGIKQDINEASTEMIIEEAGKQIQDVAQDISNKVKNIKQEKISDEQSKNNPFENTTRIDEDNK
jgi:membrane protein required for colicin V production